MSLGLYMDAHVPLPVTVGLRRRGVAVLTAQEDGTDARPDDEFLDRSTELERVLFTLDDDFLREAAVRLRDGRDFAGVVYAHQLNITFGRAILDLELLAELLDPQEMTNRVVHLPL